MATTWCVAGGEPQVAPADDTGAVPTWVGLLRKAPGRVQGGGGPWAGLYHQVDRPGWPTWVALPLPMAESLPL